MARPRRRGLPPSGYDMKAVMREVLLSGEFWDQAAYFARYSGPSSSSSVR